MQYLHPLIVYLVSRLSQLRPARGQLGHLSPTACRQMFNVSLPGFNPSPNHRLGRVSAIDWKRLTANVSGIFRRQKYYGIKQLFRRTGAAKWNLIHPLVQNSSRW